MIKTIDKNDWPLFRIIISIFPGINIFSRQAKKTTALGPIMVATAANKLWGWRVEVIDENNYRGPRDSQGLPDHLTLQKENPAAVVGFYCGLTSTMPRVWKLAEFYHQQEVFTIAGAWHAHYCPEETLRHNIDVVVHRDAEKVIRQILSNLKKDKFLKDIPEISFLENGQLQTNASEFAEVLGLDPNLDRLPFPDFGLLKHARRIKDYPISRIVGCSGNCEFCSVKEKPHWPSAEHLFETVKWLVETRNAKKFFLVDDSLREDLAGTIKFFDMIADKYGNRLDFSIQLWLKIAENIEFLQAAKRAGVRTACVGVESPIDEDLKAMKKGYASDKMLEWIKILQRYFSVHIMLIAGYPLKERNVFLSANEIVKRFRKFVRKAHPDSVHVMLPGPGVGTDLRIRLEKEGRLFPQDIVPWDKYDGRFVCFEPDNSMSLRELQELPLKIMSRFYDPLSFIRIAIRTIIFPLDYIVRGWKRWYRDWDRDITRSGGRLLLQQWQKRQKGNEFVKKLEGYSSERKSN